MLLEKTRFYRFEMYSNLSMMNENFQVINSEGQVDVFKNKMYQSMTLQNNSFEIVVIDYRAYYRENKGLWQTKKLEDTEKLNAILSEQHMTQYIPQSKRNGRIGDVFCSK